MPQGHIRKGFFFYFGLFVLLLIAIFMICLVIMMFNPGKTVLWMQYFTPNRDTRSQYIDQTTDNSQNIDWESVTNLEINCSYAKVVVDKNNSQISDGLYILNNARGFSLAADVVPFDYQVYYEGSTLKVDVTEPTGFFYLSKDIQVILHTSADSSFNFSNLNLTINTTSGDVNVGGSAAATVADVRLNKLNVSTDDANIIISNKFDSSSLTELNLETVSGRMYSTNDVQAGDVILRGFETNCNTTLKTNKGTIAFEAINVGNNELSISCKSGNIAADYIYAKNTSVACVQGNYKFGKVYGNLNYSNSEDSIIAPNLVADYISGNFILTTIGNANAEPSISIDKIDGDISLLADKGDIYVGEANGGINITSESNLKVNITVGENNNAVKRVITKNGNITLGFLGAVGNTVNIETESAKIVVNVTSVANFISTAWVNDLEGTTLVSDDKISISHGLIEGETKNPLNVRGTSAVSGTMTIKTNSSIDYNLVLKDSLTSHNIETVVE